MIVKLGQNLYSMRTTMSLAQKPLSFSKRRFSDSMYRCKSGRLISSSPPTKESSRSRKHRGSTHEALYFMLIAIGRRVLVPPPTWLNWNPISASTKALFPSVWWPTTKMAGASKGLSNSCAMLCSCEYASYRRSLPRLKKRLGVPSVATWSAASGSKGVSHTTGAGGGLAADKREKLLRTSRRSSASGLPNFSIMDSATGS
mmetsp:Transcript_6776/g.27633  ORF Transcript_6776/g.27633 Transcript_6776/m.27633 type:complete len:201 (+) Transcript_6776:9451-10053(+)